MNILLTALCLLFFQSSPQTQDKILIDWISANNLNNAKAFQVFIEDHYSQEKLKSIKIDDHIEFYSNAAEMFGELEMTPYKIIEQTKNKLVVHLTKKNLSEEEKYKSENIIQVEIETNPEGKLDKGLGMGALICYIKQ